MTSPPPLLPLVHFLMWDLSAVVESWCEREVSPSLSIRAWTSELPLVVTVMNLPTREQCEDWSSAQVASLLRQVSGRRNSIRGISKELCVCLFWEGTASYTNEQRTTTLLYATELIHQTTANDVLIIRMYVIPLSESNARMCCNC